MRFCIRLEACALWLLTQTFSPHELPDLSAAETQALAKCRTQSLAEAASIEAAFTARITHAGIAPSDWQAFRERFLDTSSQVMLQRFLPYAAGHENPDIVAKYSEAIEGYFFKYAA